GHILVTQSDGSILAAPFDPRTLTIVGPPIRVLENVFMRSSALALYDVSQNGVLTYVEGGESVRPVVIDTGGHEHDLGFANGRYAHPRLSPSGDRVVVERSDGGNSDIWIVNRATRQQFRLTRD